MKSDPYQIAQQTKPKNLLFKHWTVEVFRLFNKTLKLGHFRTNFLPVALRWCV